MYSYSTTQGEVWQPSRWQQQQPVCYVVNSPNSEKETRAWKLVHLKVVR
jgi:hypothetical protein